MNTRSFVQGDVVKILEAYQDQGDDEIVWKVVDGEENGRVTIVAANSSMSLKPTYVVSSSWICLV